MEQSFKCSCYAHEIHVELSEEPDYNIIDLVMWSQGNEQGSTFGFRLNQMWHVLRKGHCYKDMVCLKPEEAHRLGRFLTNLAEVAELRQKSQTQPAEEPQLIERPVVKSSALSDFFVRVRNYILQLKAWFVQLPSKLRRKPPAST